MISLDKKYQTKKGNEVILFNILEDSIFGAIKKDDGKLIPGSWNIQSGQYYDYCLTDYFNLVKIPNFSIPDDSLIFKPHNTKIVKYFGRKIEVPANVFYLATDVNRNLYGFTSKPRISENELHWYDDRIMIGSIGKYYGDWRDSLQAV
jgi:hypothetical protein